VLRSFFSEGEGGAFFWRERKSSFMSEISEIWKAFFLSYLMTSGWCWKWVGDGVEGGGWGVGLWSVFGRFWE
jgi:hypothetical protein